MSSGRCWVERIGKKRLLIETKIRKIDHNWWYSLIHIMYGNIIKEFRKKCGQFVVVDARELLYIILYYIILYMNMFLYKPRLFPYSNLICVVQFYSNIGCLEWVLLRQIESTVNTKGFPTELSCNFPSLPICIIQEWRYFKNYLPLDSFPTACAD